MPPTFGEYFYKHGGRVSIELDHAHHPIVARLTAWWREPGEEPMVATVAALTAPEGPLIANCSTFHPPAWRGSREHDYAKLELVCVFDDVCAGFHAVTQLISRHGGESNLEVAELDQLADPTERLRPCEPKSQTPQYDVWIGKVNKGPRLREQLGFVLRIGSHSMDDVLEKAPGVVLRGVFEPTAKAVHDVLLAHGIEHELR
ncbi:MAG TPA: hypothetical protein VK509_00415 [Polyangiales bacterium]|nr:hypothetical protein [Polyangiales bacterium]